MTSAVETDFLRLFVEGFAAYLADAGIGLSWQPDGDYTDGHTGIYIARVPTSPNRIVTLTPTPLSTDPTLSNATIGLQVRTRSDGADLRDAWLIDGAVTDALDGNYPLDLPSGVQVTALQWTSGGSLGQDDSQRWSWASNYTTRAYRPGTHRL